MYVTRASTAERRSQSTTLESVLSLGKWMATYREVMLPFPPTRRGWWSQVPSDDRIQEISYAASFMLVVGSDFSWEGIGQIMHYDTRIPTAVGAVVAAGVAYDVWKQSSFTTKTIVNGLNRLFLKDVERESRAEAGAFLAAYITGLPSFPFQPSAVEAMRCELPKHKVTQVDFDRSVPHRLSEDEIEGLYDYLNTPVFVCMLWLRWLVRMASDPQFREFLLTGNGIHRVLVWLLAGVAGEGLVHRQIIASDPRQAYAFLQMVRSMWVLCFLLHDTDVSMGGSIQFNSFRAWLRLWYCASCGNLTTVLNNPTSNLSFQDRSTLFTLLNWTWLTTLCRLHFQFDVTLSAESHIFSFLTQLWCTHCRESECELDPRDDDGRVQWAFSEARALLKDNEQVFEALRRRLESGGATVGDCVQIVER